MEPGAHPIELLELPVLERRLDVLQRFFAQRARVRDEIARLAELAEEARAEGAITHNAAREALRLSA